MGTLGRWHLATPPAISKTTHTSRYRLIPAPHATSHITISEAHPLWLRCWFGADALLRMMTSSEPADRNGRSLGHFDPLLSIGLHLSRMQFRTVKPILNVVGDSYGTSVCFPTRSFLLVFPNIEILLFAPLMLTCIYEISP